MLTCARLPLAVSTPLRVHASARVQAGASWCWHLACAPARGGQEGAEAARCELPPPALFPVRVGRARLAGRGARRRLVVAGLARRTRHALHRRAFRSCLALLAPLLLCLEPVLVRVHDRVPRRAARQVEVTPRLHPRRPLHHGLHLVCPVADQPAGAVLAGVGVGVEDVLHAGCALAALLLGQRYSSAQRRLPRVPGRARRQQPHPRRVGASLEVCRPHRPLHQPCQRAPLAARPLRTLLAAVLVGVDDVLAPSTALARPELASTPR
eukprot:945237-Rhodomonas_salina.2